jgi:hypothetical protein
MKQIWFTRIATTLQKAASKHLKGLLLQKASADDLQCIAIRIAALSLFIQLCSCLDEALLHTLDTSVKLLGFATHSASSMHGPYLHHDRLLFYPPLPAATAV